MKSVVSNTADVGKVVVLRESLVAITGSPQYALVLGQMMYWSKRTTSPDGWFYKSADDLESELMGLWSRRTIATVLGKLKKDGWLQRRPSPHPMHRTWWYKVDAERIESEIEKFVAAKRTNGEDSQSEVTPRQSNSNSGHTPGIASPSIGNDCQYNREYGSENSEHNNTEQKRFFPNPDGNGTGRNSVKSTTQAANIHDADIAAACEAVDMAMQQGFEVVRGTGTWNSLDNEVRRDRGLEMVFSDSLRIVWSKTEHGYLKEMLEYAKVHWKDRDPVAAVGGMIRASFQPDAKVFQLLKYWATHSKGHLTLRPYLTLGGGARNPDSRTAFLDEVAATNDLDHFIELAAEQTMATDRSSNAAVQGGETL